MKTYTEWCNEFGWLDSGATKKEVEAIQADAIEASAIKIENWGIAQGMYFANHIRTLKPTPPVVHHKCPACGADGLMTVYDIYPKKRE